MHSNDLQAKKPGSEEGTHKNQYKLQITHNGRLERASYFMPHCIWGELDANTAQWGSKTQCSEDWQALEVRLLGRTTGRLLENGQSGWSTNSSGSGAADLSLEANLFYALKVGRVFHYIFIYFIWVRMCTLWSTWRSENLWKSVLSFHWVGCKAWTLGVKLGRKHLYLLGHLTSPRWAFKMSTFCLNNPLFIFSPTSNLRCNLDFILPVVN